jgi:hypothetical protein
VPSSCEVSFANAPVLTDELDVCLNASKKIMRHVLGPELERYLVQKAAIILFV